MQTLTVNRNEVFDPSSATLLHPPLGTDGDVHQRIHRTPFGYRLLAEKKSVLFSRIADSQTDIIVLRFAIPSC